MLFLLVFVLSLQRKTTNYSAMNTTSRHLGRLIILALALCLTTACFEEEDTDNPTTSTLPAYKDYIATSQFTSDYAQFIDLMAAAEAYKHNLFLAYYDSSKGGFGKDEPTPAAMRDLTKRAEDIAELYDAAEPALQRLIDMGILETPIVQTRGFGWVLNYFGFFGLIKNTGEDCRKCVVGVLAQCPNPDETGRLLFEATPEYKKGETDYKTWMKNFIEGKYDNAGSRIFEFWYENSRDHATSIGNDFFNKCNDLGITPTKNLASRAADLWVAGAKFVVSVMQEAAPVPGMNSNNIKDALNGSKEAISKLAPAVITSTTAAVANATTNLLSKDRSGTTEKQQATKKQCEDAMKQYYDDLTNKQKPKEQQTTVKVKDSDTQTPARSVIVSDKKDDKVNIGIGANNGSIDVPVATDKKTEVTVTAVDATGDKYTAETTVTPGQTTVVDVTTTEKSILDKKNKVPEPGKLTIDKTSLSFSAEGGQQTIKMDIGNNHWYGGYVEGDENDDWLKVEAPDHTKCIVTAQPNTTGEKRAADIIIFATNNDDAEELTDPGVVFFRIPVTQEAGESNNLFTRMYINFDFSASGYVTASSVEEWIGQTRNQDHGIRIPIGAGDNFDEIWSLMAPCTSYGNGRYRTVRAKGSSTSNEGSFVGTWTQTYDVELTVDMQPGVDDLDAQVSGGHIVVHETCDDRISIDYDLRLGRFPYTTHLDGYAEYYFKAWSGQQTTYITSMRVVQKQVDSSRWTETTWTGWDGGSFHLDIELINPAGQSMYDVKSYAAKSAPRKLARFKQSAL